MKKIIKVLFILLAGLITFSACEDDLAEMNLNPKAANEIDPGYLLTYAQLNTSGERYENWRAVLIYSSTMIQHFATLPTYWSGDKYLYNGSYSASLWERAFTNYVKELVVLQEELKENPVELAIVNVWWVAAMHRVTDLYGDIPYSEAGKGFLEGNLAPKYDGQQSIYLDMLDKLDAANSALSGTSTFGKNDIVYGGDVTQWKKYANSLMLRLGMRLSKVDAAAAESWVKKAISNGVMMGNDDNALVYHTDGPEGRNKNGIGEVFNWNGTAYTTDASAKWSETFASLLENDPRLDVLGWHPEGAAFKAMPNGYDATTIKEHSSWDGESSDSYSMITPAFVLNAAPMIFQLYSEVELLLAEAAVRGWGANDAADHYAKGIKAHMEYLNTYDLATFGKAPIEADAIDAFVAANPLETGKELEMIGTQMWITTILNEYEAYANYRRTGYPMLTPTDYPGNQSKSQIPRRLRYPAGEASSNKAAYDAAISAQGADEFWTRMWWDAN